jgi:hypothetical protein
VRVQSTASDGAAVGDVDELHRLMTEEWVGKPVPITVLRQTPKLEITVTPSEWPPHGGRVSSPTLFMLPVAGLDPATHSVDGDGHHAGRYLPQAPSQMTLAE